MAAIPQRLETVHDEGSRQHEAVPRADPPLGPGLSGDGEAGIPIFCAGCGEVMGFLKKGHGVPADRCSACRAAEEAARTVVARPVAVPANTDELAELRSPPHDLRLIHIFQVIAVLLIFAGSACIAMGRPLGIYLATVGTLVWVAVALVRWKLPD
jgi:hypothetical protein